VSSNRRRSPRRPESPHEWIGGLRPATVFVTEGGEPMRPSFVFWLEQPSGLIVSQDLARPAELPGALARTLRRALEEPLAGEARRPAQVRVESEQLAAEIRTSLGADVPIHVAPAPELDDLVSWFAEFSEAHPPSDTEERSYLENGRVPASAVAELFTAAELLYGAAPWKARIEHVLRMDIGSLGVSGACVGITFGRRNGSGLLILPSLDAYRAFSEAAEEPPPKRGSAIDLGSDLLMLGFVGGADLPDRMRREVSEHHWPVASAAAYPVVTRIERDGVERPLVERDVRIAAACAMALAGFCVKHRRLLTAEEIAEPVCETWTYGDTAVRLTVPYDALPLFDVESAERAPGFDPQDASPVRTARVPRNAPCPCGSGKKYKKCHLARDEAAAQHESARPAALHEIDGRVTLEIHTFAQRRLGDAWLEHLDHFEGSEPEFQLAIPWSVYDYRVHGRTAAERFIDSRGESLGAPERAWIAAQQAAWLSVWEVQQVDAGESLVLLDLLSGEVRRVRERTASRSLVRRDLVLGRVVDCGGESLICGMHPRALAPSDGVALVGKLRRRLRRKGVVPIERLRAADFGAFLLDAWRDAVRSSLRRAASLPRLRNTDDEPFVLTQDRFEIARGARDAVEAALDTLPDVEAESAHTGRGEPGNVAKAGAGRDEARSGPGVGSRVWYFLGDAGRDRGRTLLGRAWISSDTLRVETNSRERADRLRARIEAACGAHLRHRAREHSDPLSSRGLLADGRSESAPRTNDPIEPALSPEQREQVLEYKRRYYEGWLDESIPALGGRTPREAARTKRGRTALERLLREMEHTEQHVSRDDPFDFDIVRRALGIG
jgi:hypothetical protein